MATTQAISKSAVPLDAKKKKREGKKLDMENIGFQLMIKQMMNQNPMNPQKPKDMSATFFQMNSTKNQTAQLEKMDKVIEKMDMMMGVQANNFKGQEIVAKGNQFVLPDLPKMAYEIPEGTKVAMIHVFNDKNDHVKTYIGESTPGKHDITFDGFNSNGAKLPEGNYKYVLETENVSGVAQSQKLGRFDLKNRSQNLMYELPQNVEKATLVMSNEEGRIVGAMNLDGPKGHLTSGRHEIPFEGLGQKGVPLPGGKYTFRVKAWDAENQEIQGETLVSGKVQWGEMKDKSPMLNLGNGLSVPLSDYRATRAISMLTEQP
ncbi:Flagellar hook assembly protein FlgD [Candidatus Bealeia paramacronuclearis]|uniref:Flagellar hook assembly protein FlgD n=1 Tax=Candidatus Bealeia paramacronuclearis TaxID=1921001 RepID=A0ABZ2C662_9PROT|nr:Flagellar hook assembly protein FlgD [Candidatus Bealeia paramacronuclearis]